MVTELLRNEVVELLKFVMKFEDSLIHDLTFEDTHEDTWTKEFSFTYDDFIISVDKEVLLYFPEDVGFKAITIYDFLVTQYNKESDTTKGYHGTYCLQSI